jgi:hypothetical protein
MYFYRANQYTFPTRFHAIHKYSLNIRKETCSFVSLWLINKIVKNHGRSGKLWTIKRIMSTYNVCDLVFSTVRKFIHSISAAKCTSPKSAIKKKKINMKTLKLDFINAKSYIIGLQNVHVRISFYRNRKPFCVNP